MRILILGDDEQRSTAVREGLQGVDCAIVGQVQTSAELHEVLRRENVDAIIANISSPDGDTLESLSESSTKKPIPIVMFVDKKGADQATEAVRAGVSSYVVDGFAPGRVQSVLQVALTRFDEFQRLRGELQQSKDALADRKVIDRAKGILMKQKGLSEADAYALLRKTAMAQNKRLVDVANSVLAIEDLLG